MKRRDKPITRTTFWLKKIKKSLWISLPSLIIAIVCYRAYSSPRHEVKKHVRQNELKKYNQESDVDVDEEDIMKLQGYFDKGNSLDIDRLSEDKAKSLCYTIFLLIKKYKMTNRQFSKQFFTNENTYEFICSDFWDQFQDTDSLPLQGVFIEEVIGPFMREIFTDVAPAWYDFLIPEKKLNLCGIIICGDHKPRKNHTVVELWDENKFEDDELLLTTTTDGSGLFCMKTNRETVFFPGYYLRFEEQTCWGFSDWVKFELEDGTHFNRNGKQINETYVLFNHKKRPESLPLFPQTS
uniref:YccV-like domain-containing protein n=1 Tax=Rhabditophanes sp. KR3021 TaxID=114890 RepID=A0AC35TGA3_9BILA